MDEFQVLDLGHDVGRTWGAAAVDAGSGTWCRNRCTYLMRTRISSTLSEQSCGNESRDAGSTAAAEGAAAAAFIGSKAWSDRRTNPRL